ncbi:M14 family zinc carboxypeptidase [Aliikangiella coralliicola]|uniref:M14 family zinc carboxypeptidase n=1 Tax=Aliikangiella coralliicola TaxID=2592383 RepID=UPI00248306DA|nr:M14 family zinc carboxypeptidase [Aliikangiella coralliicola]
MKNVYKIKAASALIFACVSFGASSNDDSANIARTNPNLAEQTLHALEQEKSTTNIYRAYFPNEDIARKASITFHSQLLESNIESGFLILQLSAEDIERLNAFGFKMKPAPEFIKRRNQRLENIQQQLMRNRTNQSNTLSPDNSIQAIPGYPCYETVEETFTAAEGIVSANPTFAQLIDIGDSWEKSQSSGGYDLRVLKLTNSNVSGDKPKLFINSAIHAREYTTAPLNLAFARWLVDGYGTNADATWIMDHHEVHLLLQANPDGRKKAETGLSWRKNTNQNYCGATSNSRGTDLNRNFSSRWNITNGQGSSGNQCSSTFRGPSAASEPETQAMESYVRSIFPDRRGPNDSDAAPSDTSGIHLDIHSYSELVLWPWGDKSSAAPNGTALQTLGRRFAYFNGYYPQQSIGLYPTDGTTDNISYGELGVPAYTFELGTSFFQSCSVYENNILPGNLPALVYAAKVVRAPYVTPSGPSTTGITINGSSNSGTIPPGSTGTLAATATDTQFSTRNGSESTQNITAAEYYIDTPPWVSGASANALSAADGNFNSTSEGITATINTSGLSEGQHIVYLRSRDASGTWGPVSAIFLVVSGDVPPDDSKLENGVAKSNLSGASGSETFFYLEVPAEANTLNFVLSGGSGDADLYVRYGSKPTTGTWDCRPYRNGNEETCTITNIQAGTYHVMLRGYRAYSGTSVTGTYTIGSGGEDFENTTNVNIPDNNSTGVTSSISVDRSGASGTVSVEVEIVHTYIGDLKVDLIAPDGSSYSLHNRTGGSSNNINQTYTANVGSVDSLGTWQLKVSDHARIDTGYIDRWKIIFP